MVILESRVKIAFSQWHVAPMDRLQSMRAFVKVAEQGSFAKASEVMNVSDTVVSRLVADLEKHLGARLLNRTTRKLSLTESGQAYLEHVLSALNKIEEAETAASVLSSTAIGKLRIYCQRQFGQNVLAKVLPTFTAEHQGIDVEITLSDRAADLVGDNYDVGIFIGGLQAFNASLMSRQLGMTEAFCFASPSYIKRHGMPTKPEDLQDLTCLNYPYEQLRHFWPIRGETGVTQVPIRSRIISNSADLLKQFAISGHGIVVLPSFSINNEIRDGQLVRVLPGYSLGKLPMTLTYPSRQQLPSKVRKFVDFMISLYPRPDEDHWQDRV